MVTLLDVSFDHGVHVQLLLCHILVEVRVFLVAHLLDDACHDALVYLQLAVLEASLQQLLGVETILLLCLLDGETDFGFRLGGLYDVEPFLARLLVALSQDFHLVARVQFLAEGYRLAIDLAAHAGVADA